MDIKDITNALRAVNDCTCEQPCLKIEILCEDAADVIERQAAELSAYRTAEQDGTLLRLPCKVGDTVYVLVNDCTRVRPDKIKSIYVNEEDYWVEFNYIWHDTNFDDFGKTVFLTREAAEAALKEQEGQK